MSNTKIPLEPDKYYHIYNHANGFENIFNDDKDRIKFLEKYKKYIVPIADTFSYCLMPNHFHILLRIKPFNKINEVLPTLEGLVNKKISYQFSHFFNSYSQSFNKKYDRMGRLFISNFGRKHVNKEKYFIKVIHYIHYNPVEHGFVEKITDWEYSSYHAIVSKGKSLILKNEVIEAFGDLENFIFVHQRPFII